MINKVISNKILSFGLIIAFIVANLLLTTPLYAVEGDPLEQACSGSAASSSVCQPTPENPIFGPEGILTGVISILSIIVGIAAFIMIIISGLRFILGGSNPETVASARNSIIFAVVGLIVALFAQAIVIFVLRKL